jgi:uncharacterized protein
MIFVDTGFWYARYVSDDADHERASKWLKSTTEPLVTTDYCVDETLTLIAARKRPELAIVAGRHLFSGSVARIHFMNSEQIHRAWILFQQRATAGWSFTDCTSKIAIDDLSLGSAAAFDQHFHQFGIKVYP